MIKFFRRIRQKLLEENRFSKYLLYAIGEIVLVVIGILIALQINNWNEQRKQSNLEVSYYENLYGDIREDSLEIDFKLKNAHSNIKKLNNVLRFIANDYDIGTTHIDPVEWPRGHFHKDTLALVYSVSQAGFVQFVDILENTIEDLRSTGSIKILKNKILKERLIRYYNRNRTRVTWNLSLLGARLEMEKSINRVLTAEQRVADNVDIELELTTDDYSNFITALKSEPEFKENLIGMLNLQHRIIYQSGLLMKRTTVLLADLRYELEQNKP